MNIIKLSMKRPVSVCIIVLALIVFGIQSIFSAPVELLPEMEVPMMLVITPYYGAGPEEVDEQITKVVETAISTIQGVEDVRSVSTEGQSMVQIMFEYGTNLENARSDVQKNLDMAGQMFPEGVMKPIVQEISMDMQDTISLSIQATGDMDLRTYVDDVISPEFEKIGGVASVSVNGGQESYIAVELKDKEMARYGLDMQFLSSQLQVANIGMPVGSIDKGSSQLILRGESEYSSAQELANMPIMTKTGAVVRLSDVANVSEKEKDASGISRFNGEETINIGIKKRQSASTLDVCEAVRNRAEQLTVGDMGVDIFVINDTSVQILSAINTLITTLVLGIVISMAVLFFFFGEWKAAIIVGISMPVSVLTTLILMEKMGFTYNLISLGGLVIGIGMMVDNSVVVLESCFRYRAEKYSPMDAALEGTKVITSSIIASTLTTVVVFLPISVMKGLTGEIFGQLGYTIIFALSSSLLSALTLSPLLFMKTSPKEKEDLKVTKLLDRMGNRYGKLLLVTFRHKWLVVFTSVALLVLSFAALFTLKVEMIPAIDQGTISISAQNRPGLKIESVDVIAKSLEAVVSEHEDVERYSVNGSSGGVSMSVYLKSDRVMSTTQVVDQWREELDDTLNYEVTVDSFNMADAMSGGSNVSINIQSNNMDDLVIASNQVVDVMIAHEDILSATSDLTDGNPQATIIVDPIKAASIGATPVQIISMIGSTMKGTTPTSIHRDGQEYDVIIEYPEDKYQSITDLEGLNFTTPTGQQVPIMDLIDIEYSNAPQSIMKMNNQYLSTISGQPVSGAKNTANAEILALVQELDFPKSVTITGGFSVESMNEEFTAMFGAIFTAVFLVFMVMAMQFESVRFSLIVMMCIPFSLIGAFGLLAITGVSLSIVSLMGLLMLVGIVINNGILFIDTANQLRSSMDARTALVYAGKMRMRPILMTTLTTVLSMVPMALGIGDGAEIMQGMAVIIIGGLVASTVLTLVLLPTFYLLVNKKDKSDKPKRNKKNKNILDHVETLEEIENKPLEPIEI